MTGDIPLSGNEFTDVELLAKDSMYVFIETTIDIDNFPNPENSYLYEDKILFDSGNNTQNVSHSILGVE